MNSGRDEEIAASVGAHGDLGPGYEDAIAAGLVERIGAEVDRRVDERIFQYQREARPAAGSDPAAGQARHPPAAQIGGQVSWQQAGLALGSMVVGLIASVSISTAHGNGTWPIIVIWVAIVFINMAIFGTRGPFRRYRRSPH